MSPTGYRRSPCRMPCQAGCIRLRLRYAPSASSTYKSVQSQSSTVNSCSGLTALVSSSKSEEGFLHRLATRPCEKCGLVPGRDNLIKSIPVVFVGIPENTVVLLFYVFFIRSVVHDRRIVSGAKEVVIFNQVKGCLVEPQG